MKHGKNRLDLRHLIIYALLGAILFSTKKCMEALPNIHPVGLLVTVYTLVYRKQALIPIYLYVLLDGIFAGFAPWWLPYLYVWTVLWGVTMLLPQKMPHIVAVPVYVLVCGLHGLCFGLLYAPVQALLFHLDLKATLAWVAAGLPFDVVHGIGNCFAGLLIVPLCTVLRRLDANVSS